MHNLTEQQAAALEVRGTSVALSAGAGCGKTTVLTERFVSALSDDMIPLDRLAALTFTDKAASELRGRVRKACRTMLDAGDDPGYWRGVLRGLEAAPIGTFHTFCGEIVRRFATRAGVDQGFTILDEPIASTCRESAVDATLRQSLRDRDADLRELAIAHGLDTVRNALISLMTNRSAPDLADWADRSPDELVAIWQAAFESKVKPSVLRRFLLDFAPCAAMLDDYDCRHHPKMRERHATILNLVPELLDSSDPASILHAIRENAMIQGGGAEKTWPSPELYATFRDTFKAIRDKVVKKAVDGLKFDPGTTATAADHGIRFARLGTRAWIEYEAVKHRRGALDFNDLLLKTLGLLRDDDRAVLNDLAGRLDLILVDEFQDTDPVQDEIIRRIAGNDFAGGRLFLVGDFKQSIYGFRDARPELFAQYRSDFPTEGQLSLTTNYRSRAAILSFVNALFADAFEADYEPLSPGVDDALPVEQPSVAFAWQAPRDAESGKDDRNIERRRIDEATRLAALIRSWIDEKRPVRDPKDGKIRAMHAGDVAILSRTQGGFIPFEKALDDRGIDYHVIGGSAFYAQQEVQDLINVLTVLDDPHDSLALAGALRSPFFAMTDEALFWFATVRAGDLASGLACPDEATLPDLSDEDRRRAFRARDLLARWRGFKDREPIAALVARVLEESGFEAALLGEPLGDRKRANARKLVRIARAFDGQGGFTLADFVDRLRSDRKSPPKEEQASTTDEVGQAVRLLTIHKAKGLEFPVVILPDLNSKSSGERRKVVFDTELGPLVNVKSDDGDEDDDRSSIEGDLGSLGWIVARSLKDEEEQAEAIRVFYVATTRARDLLVLSSADDVSANPATPAMKWLGERFDLATGLCLATLPDGWSLPDVEVIAGTPVIASRATTRKRRPPVRAVARLIERALERPADGHSVATESARPSHIVLDPSAGLSTAAARLDRLVHSIMLDPRSLRSNAIAEVAEDLSRRQFPALSPKVAAEAVERVRPWLEGPIGRALANAAEVVRDVPWSFVTTDGSVAIEGRIDLAYRDPKGAWQLVQIADARVDPALERLRLAISAVMAPQLDCGSIRQAWQITHGPDGGIQNEDTFSEASLSALLASLFG